MSVRSSAEHHPTYNLYRKQCAKNLQFPSQASVKKQSVGSQTTEELKKKEPRTLYPKQSKQAPATHHVDASSQTSMHEKVKDEQFVRRFEEQLARKRQSLHKSQPEKHQLRDKASVGTMRLVRSKGQKCSKKDNQLIQSLNGVPHLQSNLMTLPEISSPHVLQHNARQQHNQLSGHALAITRVLARSHPVQKTTEQVTQKQPQISNENIEPSENMSTDSMRLDTQTLLETEELIKTIQRKREAESLRASMTIPQDQNIYDVEFMSKMFSEYPVPVQ